MAKLPRDYRPPQPGELIVPDSVSRPLIALADDRPTIEITASMVEDVERAVGCVLPDVILACFSNGDGKLSEWAILLGEVVEHTSMARALGRGKSLIGIGHHPDLGSLLCVERLGDRQRSVTLIEIEHHPNGDTHTQSLSGWLTELAGIVPELPRRPSNSVQLLLFPDADLLPDPPPRRWLLT